MIDSLARFLYDRQAATYDADPAERDRAWATDSDIRGFWLTEAAAITNHLRDYTYRPEAHT